MAPLTTPSCSRISAIEESIEPLPYGDFRCPDPTRDTAHTTHRPSGRCEVKQENAPPRRSGVAARRVP
ncbi:Uncharacterised protein [Bordetella pertussis]|nr:Uncharacterised protein [Bordetella pertussis]CFW37113.1 Uncharacterised protein [Bordetella pertussis]